MKKFTMELVWHNCETYPPEEATNDYLIATDGVDVFEAAWYRPDGFMIHAKHGWNGLYDELDKWYWADIRQTVQNDGRFKGLIKSYLVEDYVDYLEKIVSAHTENNYNVNGDDRVLYGNNFGNDACVNCPSNPKNGGTGICFCTLGQQQITC